MVHPAQSFATVQFATILKDSAKQKQTKNKQQQKNFDKLKKLRKQECANVDHTQLCDPLPDTPIVSYFYIMIVYKIANGNY